MRVVLASSSSGSRGGGEIFLFYLAEAMVSAGHEVVLWASRHPRMDELCARFSSLGTVHRADYENTYDSWHRGVLPSSTSSSSRAIRDSLLALRPDVVHVNKQNLEDGLDLLAAVSSLPVPHLCTIHITQDARFLGARFARWRDAHARRALRAYRGPLVAVAEARARDLAAFVGPDAQVRTILNGVPPHPDPIDPPAALRQREGLRADAPAIVAVGRLEPQKCPLEFLRIGASIRRKNPDVQLRWIGSGRLTEDWNRTVAALGLGNAVRRFEWRDDVRDALPAYDLLIHPAAYEGLSLGLLEAMYAGVPCAVMPAVHAELPAVLQSCTLQITADTDWQSLLSTNALRELGQRARQIVRAEFSTAAMGRKYLALYQESCRSR